MATRFSISQATAVSAAAKILRSDYDDSVKFEGVAVSDIVEVLDHMAEKLATRSTSTSRKPSAKTTENAALRELLLSLLGEQERAIGPDEIAALPELVERGVSKARVSALLAPMVKDGSVTKVLDHKKPLYSVG